MSGHIENPIGEFKERQLPNPSFIGWLKSETALYISQLFSILGIILYFGTFSYYVFGHGESHHKQSLEEYLALANNIIFFSNIVICLLFVFVLIHILDKHIYTKENYDAEELTKRIFNIKYEKASNEQHDITGNIFSYSKFKIRNIKHLLIIYWMFAIFYYLLYIVIPDPEANKSYDNLFICINSVGAFILSMVYFIMIQKQKLGKDEWAKEYKALKNKHIFFFILFCILALLNFKFEFNTIYLKWASGMLNMIAIALIVSRLDSKLIGLSSPLISLIYLYSIIQPLIILFKDYPTLESLTFFLAFISKIYFMIVIIYIMQTGRMFNFFCLNFTFSQKTISIHKDLKRTKSKKLIFTLVTVVIPIVIIIITVALAIMINTKIDYVMIISSATIIIALYFFSFLISKKNSYIKSCSKTKLNNHFNEFFSNLAEASTAEKLEEEPRFKHLKKRLNNFISSFKYFWLCIILLYVVIIIRDLYLNPLFHGEKDFSKFKIEKKYDLDSIKNNHIFSINSLYDVIKNKEKQKNSQIFIDEKSKFKFSLLNIFLDQPIDSNFEIIDTKIEDQRPTFEYARNIYSLRDFTKNEKSTLLDTLLRENLVRQILIKRNIDNDSSHEESESTFKNLFEERLDTSITNDVKESEDKNIKILIKDLDSIEKEKRLSILVFDDAFFVVLNGYTKITNQAEVADKNEFEISANAPKTSSKPFLDFCIFCFNNWSLFYLYKCFLLLYIFSEKNSAQKYDFENEQDKTHYKKSINFAKLILILLCLSYACLAFSNTEQSSYEYGEILTKTFDAISGLLYGLVFCLLIGRLDSRFIGLRFWQISFLFFYPSLQPLFAVFSDTDKQIMEIAIGLALLSKIYFFTLIVYIVETGRLQFYFYCFPELDKRVDLVYKNQFEIIFKLNEHHSKYYIEICNQNKVILKTGEIWPRTECINIINELRRKIKEKEITNIDFEKTDSLHQEQTDNNSKKSRLKLNNAYKHEINFYCSEFKTNKELNKLIGEFLEKVAYCKISFQ